MAEKTSVLNVTLKREGTDVLLHIVAAKEIEDYFKAGSLEDEAHFDDNEREVEGGVAKTSKKWVNERGSGLRYYVKNRKLGDKIAGYRIMDNFGNGLVEGDKINLAFLRIVGISEGVTIKTTELASFEELKHYVERLAAWTRDFYEQHLVPQTITANVTLEITKTERDE